MELEIKTGAIHYFSRLAGLALLLILASSAWSAPRQVLSHHVPEAVETAPMVGRLDSSKRLTLAIGLPLRNRPALTNLLEQLYDPTSTNYHHFATPEQFAAMFGPAPEDYQRLIDFAVAHGFTVKRQHANRAMLTVEGAVADIEQAFQVTLRRYQHPTENRTFFAPDVEPSLDLGVTVLAISGLDNFVVPHPMSLKPMPAARPANAAPANGSYPGGYYIGNDFRNAYIPGVTLTGTGQVVGLLEFDAYYASDIAAYEAQANTGYPSVPLTNVYIDGINSPPGSGDVEVSLDIEMAISMAPGLSQIIVYEGGPNASGDDILSQMANVKQANQLSSSWTFGITQLTEQTFQQFALQGQSFFNASGDSDAYSNFNRPASPADDPLITIVGGTTLTTSNNGAWVSEKVWNWFNDGTGQYGSSGGVSPYYSIPTWQQGISMVANLGSTRHRNLPDVAMVGDAIVVYYNDGSIGGVGGTSCATPLWAAFMALVNQRAAAAGLPAAGFINPAVYAIGQSASFTQDFHDITVGNNTNLDSPVKYPAVAGYDLCTGWGTPNGANMIFALSPGLPIITAQPVSQTVPAGANLNLSVSAAGASTYQWQFNSNNIRGATSSSLAITNAQLANQGNYVVIVSNASGAIASSNATLTVNVPPSITNQPLSLSLTVGNTASFSVAAVGSTPLSYRWLLNSNTLPANGRISGTLSSNLVISNLLVSDAGIYQVLVANAFGSVTSALANLAVGQATPMLSWTNPSAIVYGTPLSSVQLNATASQPGSIAYAPPAGTVLGAGIHAISAIFVPSDSADYTSASNGVSLSVLTAPLTVTAFNATRTYGMANPSFGVSIAGVVNGDPIGVSASCAATTMSAPGTYPIIPSLSDPSNRLGNYSVSLVNGTLTITPAPPPAIISITPDTGSTNGGTAVNITGTGFLNGVSLYFGASPAASVTLTNATNLLAVTPAAWLGAVNVILTNTDGQSAVFTNGFTYIDTTPPQITFNPTNQTSSLGGSAAFNVTATGAGPLNYQWLLNNSSLANATNATLVFSNILSLQAGAYNAVVSNSYGVKTSSVATLSVLGSLVFFATNPGAIQYSNGQINLQLSGLTGQGAVVIDFSTDLTNWSPIFTNPAGFGQIQFSDSNAVKYPAGYYRARTPAGP
jgi:hypothetical protein